MKLKHLSTLYLIAFLLLGLFSCKNKPTAKEDNSGQIAVMAYYAAMPIKLTSITLARSHMLSTASFI
ncbi:hypothetical protein [Prolixibacter bellariivorans]|uniref:hypothetical protein n=1 Tax=Prolixibacter bellariivorans TaxID=314319 RepID=UPI001902774B|nr:hypothetical protein [Prolixibacter bellariivorans]